MRNSKKLARVVLLLTAVLVFSSAIAPALAQGDAAKDGALPASPYGYIGAAVGAGMVVIGAGMGIGRFAAAAAEGVARQPQAAAQITGAVQLPLFLLEGVAIIAVVTCLLIVLLK